MKKKFNIGNIAMKAGSVAGGVVIAKIADKPLENMKPGLRGVLKVLVGAVLPELLPAPKGNAVNLVEGIGNGILAAGAADLYEVVANGETTTTDTVEGIEDIEEEVWIESDPEDMNGAPENPIAGQPENPIAGDMDEDQDGYYDPY